MKGDGTPSSGGGRGRRGWRAALGSNPEAVALYRMSLGAVLLVEVASRFQYLHAFYSDEGTLPLRLLLPKTDSLYKLLCVHCYSGSMPYLQFLLSLQVVLAIMLIVGYRTRIAAVGSWILYLSLTLRNTWLNFILDRFFNMQDFHHLLFYSMFLPLDATWAIDARPKGQRTASQTFVSPAIVALKLLVAWLYWDAGYGKYSDPLRGWTLNPLPNGGAGHGLPALDTYVRHTVAARYLYGLLGPEGLRYMTPTVVYAEMFCGPAALLGSFCGSKRAVYGVAMLMVSMHAGIALTMRNTVLLGAVACVPWCVFLPEGVGQDLGLSTLTGGKENGAVANGNTRGSKKSLIRQHGLSAILLGAFISGSIWFEVFSQQCNQSMEHVWSTLLHNRWNVFVGAEEYVTWEIAPGRLLDGSVVDVWSKSDEVSWEMPGAGAPCTSTARAGRWRSFPYLAEIEGEGGEVLWSYLCRQWDAENGVHEGNEGRRLLRFNFFMLQADVLPKMGFSATRKRLIHSHDCLSNSNFAQKNDTDGSSYDFSSSSEL